MSVSMVDKVAKAMYDTAFVAPSWEAADKEYIEAYKNAAKAAIEAMKEPTSGMIYIVNKFLGAYPTDEVGKRVIENIMILALEENSK